jgi:rRNA maturation endonuclease Nob1
VSWSWISKIIERKLLEEVKKQLNIDVSKVEAVDVKNLRQCRFCHSTISAGNVFCPSCGRSLE